MSTVLGNSLKYSTFSVVAAAAVVGQTIVLVEYANIHIINSPLTIQKCIHFDRSLSLSYFLDVVEADHS